jgi:hypothetical protein
MHGGEVGQLSDTLQDCPAERLFSPERPARQADREDADPRRQGFGCRAKILYGGQELVGDRPPSPRRARRAHAQHREGELDLDLSGYCAGDEKTFHQPYRPYAGASIPSGEGSHRLQYRVSGCPRRHDALTSARRP